MYIRTAILDDATAIAQIYDQGIEDRVATFETKLRSAADIQTWFDGLHPIIVAVQDEQVVAFASTSSYRLRECYAGIAEFSVYVARTARGHGIGRAVLEALIVAASNAGFWKLVSRVFVENVASRKLLQTVGFREVGVYQNHAILEGRWHDVVIVERLIAANIN